MAGLSNLVWHVHCFAENDPENEDTRYDACEDANGYIFVWSPIGHFKVSEGFETRLLALAEAQRLADRAGCIRAE